MSLADDYIVEGDRIEDIRLLSLDETNCRAAIERAADFIVVGPPEETYVHYKSGDLNLALWIRFVLPDATLYEDEFYEYVRLHCPGAVPELRKLIEKFTAYWLGEIGSGGVFAAFALAWLDEASLPIVARYFKVVDSGHNGHFLEEQVDAIVARHGWTRLTIDFVIAWLEMADPTSHGAGGHLQGDLRTGAKALMSAEDFALRYHDVLARHGLWAYAKVEHTRQEGWRPGFYFGDHAVEMIWVYYYESFVGYLPLWGSEHFTRIEKSFQQTVDTKNWQYLKRKHGLNDWDRDFFIAFRRIAENKSPLKDFKEA